MIVIETPGALGRIVAQQEQCILNALPEHLVRELSVGQRSGDLERPDHQGEDAERPHAC